MSNSDPRNENLPFGGAFQLAAGGMLIKNLKMVFGLSVSLESGHFLLLLFCNGCTLF